jgi:hypothetical protein
VAVASITVRQDVSSVGARSTESGREPFTPSIATELATVVANAPVNAEYRHLVVACSETAATGAPGQFFQLLCPQSGGEQPYLRRPMSIYGASVAERKLEFLYKVTGSGTRGLDTLKAGDRLDIMGRSATASNSIQPGATSSRWGAALVLQRSPHLPKPSGAAASR